MERGGSPYDETSARGDQRADEGIDDPLSIVIVRDMWLTGTDIPYLHTLYVDKPMRGHKLCRRSRGSTGFSGISRKG